MASGARCFARSKCFAQSKIEREDGLQRYSSGSMAEPAVNADTRGRGIEQKAMPARFCEQSIKSSYFHKFASLIVR